MTICFGILFVSFYVVFSLLMYHTVIEIEPQIEIENFCLEDFVRSFCFYRECAVNRRKRSNVGGYQCNLVSEK